MSKQSINHAASLLDDIVYWMEFMANKMEKEEMNQEGAAGLKASQEKYLQLTERLSLRWQQSRIKQEAGKLSKLNQVAGRSLVRFSPCTAQTWLP